MKVTYICDRCGAIIGSLNLTDDELQQIGLGLSDRSQDEDVIKSAPADTLFVYSFCDICVDFAPAYEFERTCLKNPDLR